MQPNDPQTPSPYSGERSNAWPEPAAGNASNQPPAQPTFDPSAGVIPPVQTPVYNATPPKPRRNRRLMLLIAAGVVLLGTTAAAYFGIVVPNKPENLWASALHNTSRGYDKLVEYGSQKKGVKGYTLTGSYRFEGEAISDGSLEGSGYEKNSRLKADFGLGTTRLDLELLTTEATGSNNPDIFVKLSGVKGLGTLLGAGPEFTQQVDNLNDKWVVIDHTLLDNLEAALASSGGSRVEDLTPDETIAIARAIGEVNKKYIFTEEARNSLLVVKEQVGKEKRDGRSVYRYKVGYSKERLKAYATELKDRLKTTPVTKLFQGRSIEETISFDELVKSIDELDEKGTADVWVDTRTRMVRTVRFADAKDKETYTDIGLNYNGGDEYPFALDFHTKAGEETTKVKVTATLKPKTDTLDFGVDYDSGQGDNKQQGNVKLQIKGSDQRVNVQKPDDALQLAEVLEGFGIDPEILSSFLTSLSEVQLRARDTERQTDINTIHAQLEAYFAQNGRYPTLANMNDKAFRTANMQGLDEEALIDPESGGVARLAAAPAPEIYAYEVRAFDSLPCDNVKKVCDIYTLTATLDGGGTFTKKSLNN